MIDALSAAGIMLRSYRLGQHRGPCPKCNKGPRDDALGVTIADDGVVWHCFRCNWTGNATTGTTREGEPRIRHHRDEARPATLSDDGRKLFREAGPIASDNIGGRYFINRCSALPQSDHVRLHRGVWHPAERKEIPAIISLITDVVTTGPISLHMTFIARDGGGKAPIERPRLYLAGHRKAGGVVRLHEDAEVDQGLIIGEGLETCLSYALEFRPIWACLDAGNIAAFPVLNGIEALTVLVDNDPAGIAAFETVAAKWRAAGKECIGIKSPVVGQDVNDVVTA